MLCSILFLYAVPDVSISQCYGEQYGNDNNNNVFNHSIKIIESNACVLYCPGDLLYHRKGSRITTSADYLIRSIEDPMKMYKNNLSI